jgi:HTH-type transcriptional regulator, cell division transcriptional repressor
MTFDTHDGEDAGTLDYSDAAATFGDRLILARDAAGMTSADLAARLDVMPETLRAWEGDQDEPRSNKLQTLAGLLNVPMVWLMSGQGAAPRRGAAPAANEPSFAACLAELRGLCAEHGRMVERLGRLESRLRAVRA